MIKLHDSLHTLIVHLKAEEAHLEEFHVWILSYGYLFADVGAEV